MRAGMVDRRIVTTLAKDRLRKRGPVQVGDEHYVYRRNGEPCRFCGTKRSRRWKGSAEGICSGARRAKRVERMAYNAERDMLKA